MPNFKRSGLKVDSIEAPTYIEEKTEKENNEKLTKVIFENKEVLKQLEESERELEETDLDNINQIMKYINEKRNEQQ